MYLRCSRCHAPIWLRSLVPGMVEPAAACRDCGHLHDLARASELGDSGKRQYETANAFARANGVDLPTAYSVLLGLITLQEARAVDAERQERQRKQAAPIAPVEAAPNDAVPVARAGRREGPPRRQSHGRRREDRQVTIHVERDMAEQRRQVTGGQIVLLALLAALTFSFAARQGYRTWRKLVEESRMAQKITAASVKALEKAEQAALAEAQQSRPAIPEALRAELRRDQDGRLVQVIGPNPLTVLEAYCEASSGTYEREPLELAQASPPSPDERYGIFRDFARLESNHAIRIRRDRKNRRWSAGDGRGPIPTREAPEAPDTVHRVSLRDPN